MAKKKPARSAENPVAADANCSRSDRLMVRWLIRNDMPQVIQIEEQEEHSWNHNDFLEVLSHRNCIGMVAGYDLNGDRQQLLGYMIYELKFDQLHVLNFVVRQSHRRTGVGTAMVDKLKEKLSQQRRNEIIFDVRETNLDACLFLRVNGFEAVDTMVEHYEDTGEDGLRFMFHSGKKFDWHEIADGEATVKE